MARIRSIKPDIWTDERFVSLSFQARLLCIGMISTADDEGRFMATGSRLAGEVMPADDVSPAQVEAWRDEAAASGLVVLYVAGSITYGYFPRWKDHQKIHNPALSKLPAPPAVEVTAVRDRMEREARLRTQRERMQRVRERTRVRTSCAHDAHTMRTESAPDAHIGLRPADMPSGAQGEHLPTSRAFHSVLSSRQEMISNGTTTTNRNDEKQNDNNTTNPLPAKVAQPRDKREPRRPVQLMLDSGAEKAAALVEPWWHKQDPKPASYEKTCDAVRAVTTSGWSDDAIIAGLSRCLSDGWPITVASLETALRKPTRDRITNGPRPGTMAYAAARARARMNGEVIDS